LGLSLVSDAFSHNLKTLVSLRKSDGKIEWEIHVPQNDGKRLQKSIFLEAHNRVAETL